LIPFPSQSRFAPRELGSWDMGTSRPDFPLNQLQVQQRAVPTSHYIGLCRLTRLTNGFSKKWENHWAALCLHFAYYNFCRIHKTLRVTPAMQAGITDRVWDIAELLS